MMNIAVFVSGGGTNLQALIDAQDGGVITGGRIALVVSNNPDAYALKRAEKAGIETVTLNNGSFPDRAAFDEALLRTVRLHSIDLVVLAGFMRVLGKHFCEALSGRIINVHPALIPSFCGKGFYGLKVHEAALAYGVKVTGATVHFVNEVPDGGKIIMQKAVDVLDGDTPETLQKRVMEQAEWIILPKAVEKVCSEIPKMNWEAVK